MRSQKKILWSTWVVASAIVVPLAAQQAFTGKLSTACAAFTSGKAAGCTAAAGGEGLTDRQCLLACINALAKYVLVDSKHQVIRSRNQDAMGLPLYAGRPVTLTGERRADAVLVTKVEAIPAHLHIGHV